MNLIYKLFAIKRNPFKVPKEKSIKEGKKTKKKQRTQVGYAAI